MFGNLLFLKLKNHKNQKWVKKKIVFSRPLENYVLDLQNYVWDIDFVETKFIYKNDVLDLSL